MVVYNFLVSEEDHYYIAGRGHTFVIKDHENKAFKLGNPIIINGQQCIIKGIESTKNLFDGICNLALLVSGYKEAN